VFEAIGALLDLALNGFYYDTCRAREVTSSEMDLAPIYYQQQLSKASRMDSCDCHCKDLFFSRGRFGMYYSASLAADVLSL
jgi:hypothetical protein